MATKSSKSLYNLALSIISLYLSNIVSIVRMLFTGTIPYLDRSFITLYGGRPLVHSGLNLSTSVVYLYPNVVNGKIYYGCNFIVKCRPLEGVYDLDGYQIYETPERQLFVYRYLPLISETILDEGRFLPPKLDFEERVSASISYRKASETVVDIVFSKLNIKDEWATLTLINAFTELQSVAYLQGKGLQAIPPKTEVYQSDPSGNSPGSI